MLFKVWVNAWIFWIFKFPAMWMGINQPYFFILFFYVVLHVKICTGYVNLLTMWKFIMYLVNLVMVRRLAGVFLCLRCRWTLFLWDWWYDWTKLFFMANNEFFFLTIIVFLDWSYHLLLLQGLSPCWLVWEIWLVTWPGRLDLIQHHRNRAILN